MEIIQGALTYRDKTAEMVCVIAPPVPLFLISLTYQRFFLEFSFYSYVSHFAHCQLKIMTPLDSIFMLPIETVLDFETITNIYDSGYRFEGYSFE